MALLTEERPGATPMQRVSEYILAYQETHGNPPAEMRVSHEAFVELIFMATGQMSGRHPYEARFQGVLVQCEEACPWR